MESQRKDEPTSDNQGDAVIAGIIFGALLCLAGVGVHSLVSKNKSGNTGPAGNKEDSFIEDFINRELA